MKIENTSNTPRLGTVTVSDAHGTWTLEAKLTHIVNTSGIPPKSPGPHLPYRTLLAGLEDLLREGNRSTQVMLGPK